MQSSTGLNFPLVVDRDISESEFGYSTEKYSSVDNSSYCTKSSDMSSAYSKCSGSSATSAHSFRQRSTDSSQPSLKSGSSHGGSSKSSSYMNVEYGKNIYYDEYSLSGMKEITLHFSIHSTIFIALALEDLKWNRQWRDR